MFYNKIKVLMSTRYNSNDTYSNLITHRVLVRLSNLIKNVVPKHA